MKIGKYTLEIKQIGIDKLYWLFTAGKCKKCGKTIVNITNEYYDYCSKCIVEIKLLENINNKIFDYDYKPVPTFFKREDSKLYIGVEIEIFSAINHKILVHRINKKIKKLNLNNFLYLKKDGSVNPVFGVPCFGKSSGIEIVSMPATINFWYYLKPRLYKFFKFIERNGGGVITYSGLHIHINKKLKDSSLKNIINFFNFNRKFIRKIAGRKENHYCEYCNDFFSHYNAISLRKYGIEYRIFKSTLDVEYFYSKLEWVLFFTKNHKNLYKFNEQYAKKYFKKYKKKYPHIYKLFVKEAK